MADLDLIDRIIRLGEVATAAPDEVRAQLVLTLKWINCPFPLAGTLGGNAGAALVSAKAMRAEEELARFEGYRDPRMARAGCSCGAERGGKHWEGCPMPVTAERGVDREELPEVIPVPSLAALGGGEAEGGTPPSMGPSWAGWTTRALRTPGFPSR